MQVTLRLLLAAVLLKACTTQTPALFEQIPASKSGITFNNQIVENEMLNMINYQYLYNGGGVGIGDFNNDGLPDIYFTASLQSNKLYLNRGNLRFEDVTEQAGVTGEKKWCRGVAVVDINNDGLLDMYVSAAAWQNPELKKDILYVNQGVDAATGIPRFREMAKEYGLVDTVSTHMAAFFDYDNDGDLDLYLVVNDLNQEFPSTFRKIRNDGSGFTNDILYRCDWSEELQHPVYKDVSREAGITWEGNGLGVVILDINNDGWKDIYVSNDYLSGNLLYINNRNGTFTNRNNEYFQKGSLNAMGNDAADINNDGLVDIVEMDMMPEDNYRQKMMMNPVDYNWYVYSQQFGFPYQTVRNTLQLNRGPRVLENDSLGAPFFSEIAFYAGMPFTDWSWAALLVDADNDGYRDLMTTNGLPKDVTDLDFIAYRDQNLLPGIQEALLKLPAVHISNYIFRNNGNCTFSNKTSDWGWNFPTYSAGIAYADFDGDGDMDVVINNTNMPATLLENKARQQPKPANYLQLRFRGDTLNMNGLGTTVTLHYGSRVQTAELTPYRGYMSSVEPLLHFGLDTVQQIDSIVIIWPNSLREVVSGVPVNQTLLLSRSSTATPYRYEQPARAQNTWFTNRTTASGLLFAHNEEDYVDFHQQRQQPFKYSSEGPVLAVADVDADGLEDVVVGGSAPYPAMVFRQQKNGRFQPAVIGGGTPQAADDGALCLFDADGDGYPDLYVGRGGNQHPKGHIAYRDVLYRNDGKGNFIADTTALPPLFANTSVVKAADVDGDGDLDVFVGARMIPGEYPRPADGYLLRNDSRNGTLRFTLVTEEWAPELKQLGMITDAVWTDLNGDRQPDLVITGEWMGIRFFQNNNGKLKAVAGGTENATGWYTRLAAADLDGDGDTDFVVGNFGTNGFYKGTPAEPVTVYANDYDGNNRWNALLSIWQPTVLHGPRKEVPVAGRDQLAEEMPIIKKQFANYQPYAKADMQTVLANFNRQNEIVRKAVQFHSVWLENKGNFRFELHALPAPAQWSPVYGIATGDFNSDGKTDIVLSGNQYDMHPLIGRYDAGCGLLLAGVGKGVFEPVPLQQSGIFIPGNARGLATLRLGSNPALIAARNKDHLLLFAANTSSPPKEPIH
ncbi:MAG: FG-GAP-like repeat-containing protein [Lacibacter sp.]